MKRLSFIAAALLCFVTMAGAAIRPAQPGIGGGGSSGVTTGSVTVLTPLILSGTEIQLPLVLSNLKTNLALTNANANQFSTSGGTAIKSGVLLTNTVNEGNFTNNTTGAGFIRQISSAANGGFEAIVGGTTLASLSTLLGIRATNTVGSKLLVSDDVGAHSFMSRTGTFFSGHLLLDSNLVVSGGSTLSSLTASRPLILNASGNVTNATGTPDGTKFLRDDGTLAVPSGGAGSPGGTTTTMQYNQGGSFAGSSNFVYDQSLQDLEIWSTSSSPTFSIGYTNGSTGKTNVLGIGGIAVYSPNGNATVAMSILANGVANGVVVGTNYTAPSGYTMHQDLGLPLLLWRSLYVGSNAIVGGSLTVTNSVTAQSFIGSGTGSPVLQLFATNNNAVVMGIAISNSVMITNLVGQLHKANAVYIELDCNHGNDFHITNRIAQNTIVNWLNPAQGQTLSLRLHGAVSGGTDYFVTNTFPTSWLAMNQSSNTGTFSTQLPVSMLDGTGAEINIRNYRFFMNSTNVAGAIINTYTE